MMFFIAIVPCGVLAVESVFDDFTPGLFLSGRLAAVLLQLRHDVISQRQIGGRAGRPRVESRPRAAWNSSADAPEISAAEPVVANAITMAGTAELIRWS